MYYMLLLLSKLLVSRRLESRRLLPTPLVGKLENGLVIHKKHKALKMLIQAWVRYTFRVLSNSKS